MYYENSADREKQRLYLRLLDEYFRIELGWVEFEIKETPPFPKHSHDAEIVRLCDRATCGYIEVKCRQYDAAFFSRNGWAMDVPRIEYMRDVTMGGRMIGAFGLLTSDEKAYVISLERLNSLTLKPSGKIFTDDHGRIPNGKNGVIIPLKEMTYIGERGNEQS